MAGKLPACAQFAADDVWAESLLQKKAQAPPRFKTPAQAAAFSNPKHEEWGLSLRPNRLVEQTTPTSPRPNVPTHATIQEALDAANPDDVRTPTAMAYFHSRRTQPAADRRYFPLTPHSVQQPQPADRRRRRTTIPAAAPQSGRLLFETLTLVATCFTPTTTTCTEPPP